MVNKTTGTEALVLSLNCPQALLWGFWTRRTPGEIDLLILSCVQKKNYILKSQNVLLLLANFNLFCFTTESTSVFRKHLKKVLFHSELNILCFIQSEFVFPLLKSKTDIFLFGVTWNFFFFLDSSKIDYIHAIPKKIAAFFSHAIKFAIKTKQRNNSSGLEKYSWNTGNQKKNYANCS